MSNHFRRWWPAYSSFICIAWVAPLVYVANLRNEVVKGSPDGVIATVIVGIALLLIAAAVLLIVVLPNTYNIEDEV